MAHYTYVVLSVNEHIIKFKDDGVGSLVWTWQDIREKLCARGLCERLKNRR